MRAIQIKSRFQWAAIATAMGVILLLILYMSKAQGLAAFINTYLLPLIAIVSSLTTLYFWRNLKGFSQASKILLWFGVGLALWGVAEVIWLVFVLLNVDPYPSIADLFWIIGYLFFIAVLYNIMRHLHVRLSLVQQLTIFIVVAAGSVLVLFLILIPIIQDFSIDRIWEVITNLAYPILDLFLLYQVVSLVFISRQSDFDTAWRIIALSIGMVTLADLAFTYANWYDLYQSDATTLLTQLIDWGYLAFYPILMLGIYGYFSGHESRIENQSPSNHSSATSVLITNTFYLVYTNAKDEVIMISDNLKPITSDVNREPLPHFLARWTRDQDVNIQEIYRGIKRQIDINKMIRDYPFHLILPNREPNLAWLSGIALQDYGKTYTGMNLLVRTYRPGAEPLAGMSQYDRGIMEFISSQCGLKEFPFLECATTYAEQYIQMVYSLLVRNLGELVARSMLEQLHDTINREGWEIEVSQGKIQIPANAKMMDTFGILARLVRQASEYSRRILDVDVYQHEKSDWDHKLSNTLLLVAEDYGIAAA